MFGYVRPQKSELLVREFEEYKAVYCALCRRLGKDYGPAARLVLNYDCTFYAVLRIAAFGQKTPRFSRGRCVANPLKKCIFCVEDGGDFAAAAALTVILTYYKVCDDIADSGFWKSLFLRAVKPFFAFPHRRAARRFPGLEEAAADFMREQAAAERSENPGVDAAAEPTARMLSRVFGGACDKEETKRVLCETGYYLGRWTYLMDAADDMEKDIRHKTFNPFVLRFRLNGASGPEERNEAREYANATLNGTLARLGAAVELLEPGCFGPLVRNVVFLGLPAMQKERLYKKESGNVRSV